MWSLVFGNLMRRPLRTVLTWLGISIAFLLLALLGTGIGSGLGWAVFNGWSSSTLNQSSYSQVVYDFAVTSAILTDAALWRWRWASWVALRQPSTPSGRTFPSPCVRIERPKPHGDWRGPSAHYRVPAFKLKL